MIIYTIIKGDVHVKYEADGYVLKQYETLTDVSLFVKPDIINSEVIEKATLIDINKHNTQKNRERIAEFNSVKKSNGLEYFIEIDNRITELMQGKNESEIKVLDKQLRAKITSIIVLIKDGQWFTARDYINNRGLPTIPEVKALFLEVREKARNYVNENYNI